MARTISEIKAGIGNYYIGFSTIQALYGFTTEQVALGYDALFSKVAGSNLFFYAYAFCVYTFELILDAFRIEIKSTVDAGYIANDPWWHSVVMAFQRGDDLVLNPTTFKWSYAVIDATKQIIKRVAVRQKVDTVDSVYKVFLYVATENNGVIEALTNNDKTLLEAYVFRQKYSGVLTKIVTGTGDVVDLSITINYNPLLLTSAGLSLANNIYPVNVAIANFIKNLNDTNFGGKLNVTKLIDDIQSAEGVVDAKITQIKINDDIQAENWGTYESTNGWFSLGDITPTYQPQTL